MEHKLTQFAHDTLVLLDGSDESLKETLKTFAAYTLISGLKVYLLKQRQCG